MTKPNISIEDQVKAAERDKFLAEAKKAESERKKIDYELAESIKETSKPTWRKKEFRNTLIAIFLGLSFLGFYIEYAVLPFVNRDNLLLSVENAKAQKRLIEGQEQLHTDSLKLVMGEIILKQKIKYTDSLTFALNSLKASRHKVDSSYSILSKLYQKKQDFNSVEVQNEFIKFKQYLDEYKSEKEKVNELSYSPITGYWKPTTLGSITENGESTNFLIQPSKKLGDSTFIFPRRNLTLRPLYKGQIVKDLTFTVSDLLGGIQQKITYDKETNSYYAPLFSVINDVGNTCFVNLSDGNYKIKDGNNAFGISTAMFTLTSNNQTIDIELEK